MKTTLDLPGHLMREVKIRAASENRKLKDLIAELLATGLATPRAAGRRSARRKRARLPLIACRHAASDDDEMTPQRVADVLLQQEARTQS